MEKVPKIAVVVDGARIAVAGNVSESYNSFFQALQDADQVVVHAAACGSLMPLVSTTHVLFLLFEPGLWNQDLSKWWWDWHMRVASGSPVALFIDDVHGAPKAVSALTPYQRQFISKSRVGMLTPYPVFLHQVLERHQQRPLSTGSIPIRYLPHVVAPVFFGARKQDSHPRQTCVVWGCRAAEEYPGRAAVAAAAGTCSHLSLLPEPTYGTQGSAQRRVPPAAIVRSLDSSTCCYAGGDKMGVLTAKHFEGAARGTCVITGSKQAKDALAIWGLVFVAADTAEEVCMCAAAMTPGQAEATNAAIVARHMTSDGVVRGLLGMVTAIFASPRQ